MATISGTTLDASNNPVARLVRVYSRDTGELVGAAVSDATTGAYSVGTSYSGRCFVVAHDGTAIDPFAAETVLALRMAGANGSTTFIDDMGKSPAANGDVHIVAGAMGGKSAAYFDGSGDYISVPYASDLEVESGDFAVEFLFKVPDTSGPKTFFAFQSDFHLGVFLNGNRMSCFASSNGSGWNLISGDSNGNLGAGFADVSANVWHHFAWVRLENTWTMYLDGAVDRQLTGVAGTVFSRNEPLNIGRWGNAGYWMNGYIKDFRLTRAARYDTTFSVPVPDFVPPPSGGTQNAVILDRVWPL